MHKLRNKVHTLNFNSAYFTGHQGKLICARINRTGGDVRKVSPLCMNELCIVLSAAVATLGSAYTFIVPFKAAESTRIL